MAKNIGHIYIYGDIVNYEGSDSEQYGVVGLRIVKDAFDRQADADEIVVHIHSNGGSVYEGFAIHDFLKTTGKKITTVVEGMCASIATVIFLAGTERKITENSRFLIHNPNMLAIGDAEAMREAAETLEAEQKRILDFYVDKTGGDEETLKSYMNEDKVMDAAFALEMKFATEIIETTKAMALYRNEAHRKQILNSTNKTDMENTKKTALENFIKSVTNIAKEVLNMGVPPVVNKFKLANGTEIFAHAETLEAGTEVFEDEKLETAVSETEIELEDGAKVVLADGVVESVEAKTTEDDDAGAGGDADKDAEIADLKAKLVAKDAEIAELTEIVDSAEVAMTEAEKALAHAKSTYKPEARVNKFKKPLASTVKADEDDMKAKMAARRAEIAEKNKK